MTGAYPSTVMATPGCRQADPLTMMRWWGGSVGAPGWCLPGDPWQFSAVFLRTFGGRWDPDLGDRAYEWFTSPFIHQHFIHLFANVVLLLLMGCEVERRYGAPRIALLFVISMLGGNVLSAVADARCAVVVGLSGAIFGIMPLYIIDLVKHWRDMTAPALNTFFFVVFLITFGASIIRQPNGISHLSHVGGLVTGIFPALLYQYHLLPHHDDSDSVHHLRIHPERLERLETLFPILSAICLAIYFITLFTLFYTHVLPTINCPQL